MNKKKTIIKQKNISSEDEEQIDNIDMLISSDREYEKLVKVLGELECESGTSNSTNIWKEFRKAYPKKVRPVPPGVKNVHGKVITNPNEKKHITLKHFMHRMRKRPTHEDTKEIAHMGGISQDVKRLKIWDFYTLFFGFSLPFTFEWL